MNTRLLISVVVILGIIGTPLLLHSETSSNKLSIEELTEGVGVPPLRYDKDQDTVLLEFDGFVEWSVDVYRFGYVQGAAFQIRKLQPRIDVRNDIIDEKDTVIRSFKDQTDRLDDELLNARSSLTIQTDLRRVAEEQLESETTRANTWRTRFWITAGVSVGVGVLVVVLAL